MRPEKLEHVRWFQSTKLAEDVDHFVELPLNGTTSGQIQVIRADRLCRADRCDAVAANALEYLFETRNIDGLAGCRGCSSVRALSSVLQQMAVDCQDAVILIHATPRSVQRMRSSERHVRENTESLDNEHDPDFELLDQSQRIYLPQQALGLRGNPIRFFFGEHRGAVPFRVSSVGKAYDHQREVYHHEQWLFTVATPEKENLALLHEGKAPAAGIERILVAGGYAIESPTIRIDRLMFNGHTYTHARFGMNFTLGGEYVRAISTAMDYDFGAWLEFFPPEFVLGRVVLEGWLQSEADRAGVDSTGRASTVLENLRKAGIFATPKWRQIQSLLDIGNAAAHGDTQALGSGDINRLLEFVETDCGHP